MIIGDIMEQQILDIFYNKIVQEAQTGRVDCFFMMNMIFNLNVENIQITSTKSIEKDGLLVPTLKITNKELFDSLLVEYVEKAISFYDEKEFSFLEDIKYLYPDQDIEQLKEEYLIKYIICTLLANLSYSDFEYPLGFLEDRIEMFDNKSNSLVGCTKFSIAGPNTTPANREPITLGNLIFSVIILNNLTNSMINPMSNKYLISIITPL